MTLFRLLVYISVRVFLLRNKYPSMTSPVEFRNTLILQLVLVCCFLPILCPLPLLSVIYSCFLFQCWCSRPLTVLHDGAPIYEQATRV